MNLFYWSTIDILLWGFMTAYLNQVGKAGFNFMTVILGAVVLWNFFTRVQYGLTISFLEDVWTRNFINLFSTPLTILEYVAGIILTSFITAFISLGITVFLAWLFFAYNIFQFGFLLVPFMAVLFIFGWSVGLFATAVILRFGPSAEIFAWSFPLLFSPLSSVFYPISALPDWLEPVSRAIPATHIFEGMRGVVLTGVFDWGFLFSGFLLSMLYFAVSYVILLRAYRIVLKRGLFTRFSTD